MTREEARALARAITEASGPRRKAILTPDEEACRQLVQALKAEGVTFPGQGVSARYQAGGRRSGEYRAWVREVRRIAVNAFFEALPASYRNSPFSKTTLERLRDDLTERTGMFKNIPMRTLQDDLLAVGKRSARR